MPGVPVTTRRARSIRWFQEYLARYAVAAPVSIALFCLTLFFYALHLWLGKEVSGHLLFYPGALDKVYQPGTGFFFSYRPTSALVAALFLLLLGPLAEGRLGSARFSLISAASYVFPSALLVLIFSVGRGVDAAWAGELGRHSVFGLPLALIGVLTASSGAMPTIWRRRTRLLTGVLALSLLGFGGSLQDIGLLLAVITGLAAGAFLQVGRTGAVREEHSLVGTRHETRTRVALLVAAVMVGTFFSAHMHHPMGPLAAARFGITPDELTYLALDAVCNGPSAEECNRAVYLAQTQGAVPAVLATLPLILQIVFAWGLRRGRRAALWGTVLLQGAVAFFALLHLSISLEITEALPASALAEAGYQPQSSWRLVLPVLLPLVLIAVTVRNRRFFSIASEPGQLRRVLLLTGVSVLGGLGAMLLLALAVPQGFAPHPQLFPFALDYLSRLLPSAAWSVFSPSYSATFWLTDIAQGALPILTWLVLIVGSFRTFARPAAHEGAERDDYVQLVRTHGAGTLGWISTWTGRRYWVSERGDTGFAYVTHNGIALTVGDPAAPAASTATAVEEFARFCTSQSLVPALYSVHSPAATAARQLGWSTWQVAEEAVIELPQLAFSGKKFQSIRTALNQAGKQGVHAEWVSYGTMPLAYWSQIVEISEGWIADKGLPEMGFTLGGLDELKDPETRILVAVDGGGFIHGVTSWMPVHREGEVIGLTLDFMRRREGEQVFAASMEFLIATAALNAKDEGLELLSLSGAPLAHSAEPADRRALDRLLDYLGQQMEPLYGFRSLLTFKAKFRPVFDPMYLATPDPSDLVAIGLAVSHAYLPTMTAKDLLAVTSTLGGRGGKDD